MTLFASAFLLFVCQPLVGKMVLPFLGGAAAVWTTCVLFFQVMLLALFPFPFLVGPPVGAAAQGRLWFVGYRFLRGLLAVASALLGPGLVAALGERRVARDFDIAGGHRPPLQALYWVAAAFVPSG